MKRCTTMVVVCLLAVSGVSGLSAAEKIDVVVKGDTLENFQAVAAAVRKQMEPGGYYQYIHGDERHQVDELLRDMETLFKRHATVDEMGVDDKRQLADDQETINAILTQRDSRRIVCESVRPTGSNIPRRVCRTYGQIEAEHQGVQRMMQDLQSTPQHKAGG